MSSLAVNIAGVQLKNPLIAASGTFGYGREYEALYPLSVWGGISLKGMTLAKRMGNPPPRVAETPLGLLNSVGLQNPGVDYFLEHELPNLRTKATVLIANVAGSTLEDYRGICERLDGQVDMIELNISCPNVKEGGAAFGTSCESAAGVVRIVRPVLKKTPLMVKLTPNVTDIASVAQAVESEGADAVSLINTILGMRINIATRRPILKNNVGGLSGPAVFPVALRMVWQVANRVHIPVVGLGGISTWQDAVEMMLAGACAVQVGSAMFSDAYAPVKIAQGLQKYLDDNGIRDINSIVGQVKPW
ncbi:MAG: dihydroorotate dehydrogenase [Acetanaerobacterium sp.]